MPTKLGGPPPIETIIWTALPNGYFNTATRHVELSVFVAPHLEATGGSPTLELFPHWHNWPQTVQSAPAGPLAFDVTFTGYPAVRVKPDMAALSATQWSAVFNPSTTRVDSYTFTDYSKTPPTSFSASGVSSFVSGLYGKIGAATSLRPPLFHTERGLLELNELPGNDDAYIAAIASLRALGSSSGDPNVAAALAFHKYPKGAEVFQPAATVLDFHQAVAALGSFPDVLVSFGLVFRLNVPLPKGLTPTSSLTSIVVEARPVWKPASTTATTIDVVLKTQAKLSTKRFLASPATPSYRLGMLDLAKPYFSVIDLDVDGAAESLSGLSISLQSLGSWLGPLEGAGDSVSVPIPALRSTGPSITWSGWGGTTSSNGSLNALAQRQTALQDAVSTWVTWYQHSAPRPAEPPLPVLRAEDIIRGHRFDVHSEWEPTPAWRSLHQRAGTYTFGTSITTKSQDEGTVVPGATQPATTKGPMPDIYVHESIARWAGWSLSVPRNGPSIAPDDQVDANPTNPVASNTDPLGNQNAQMTVNFQVVPGTLPRLRYGRKYRYRARAVDMGGHSLPLTSTDASSATPLVPHYRYQPVASPVVVPTAPLGPGEAVLLIAVLNYQDGSTINPNGRWLFPPKASQMLVEEHGMLDGYVAGKPPDFKAAPTAAAYALLASRVDGTLESLPSAKQATTSTSARSSYTYLPVPTSGRPAPLPTPWLPDPLSSGIFFQGLPSPSNIHAKAGLSAPPIALWPGGIWPGEEPVLLWLEAGGVPTNALTKATATTAAVETVTLPPAQAAIIYVSSTLSLPALATMGVWSWVLEAAPATERAKLTKAALAGLIWMLTPYRVLRLVHAVRKPLEAPAFRTPELQPRTYGSVQATLHDASFLMSTESTASIDVEASWADPLDDPSDPSNNPATATVVTHQHAFKLVVPEPLPLGPWAEPMKVVAPVPRFALYPGGGGAVHTIGDTKHHYMSYECTGTSRFVEFFRQAATKTFPSSSPVTIDGLGLDPRELVIEDKSATPPHVLRQDVDYKVDATKGEVSVLTSAYQNVALDVTWVPADTERGPVRRVHVLASARPAAPKVVKVTPAWSLSGVGGSLADGGLSYSRKGGYLRVYLERPWFSSGAGELLGVVAVPASAGVKGSLPSGDQANWVTMMALDPISVSSRSTGYPVSPTSFTGTAKMPKVPYRAAYSSPPQLQLVEASNPGQPTFAIWPFEVHYDKTSGLWFADVGVSVGTEATAPPPGYFVRLALVRFQPYAFDNAELSTVTLATFAQPVANRAVSVTEAGSPQTLTVTVTGPGYYGYRPVLPPARGYPPGTQVDVHNPDAEHPYSYSPISGKKTSSMVLVEVQSEDTSKGLKGDLAWATVTGTTPVALEATFSGGPEVTWSGSVKLPRPYSSSPAMRLRISEVDYPTSTPKVVNSSLRRPFVALVPLLHNPAVHRAPA